MAQKVTFSHLRGVFDRVDEVAPDYYRLHPCGNKGPLFSQQLFKSGCPGPVLANGPVFMRESGAPKRAVLKGKWRFVPHRARVLDPSSSLSCRCQRVRVRQRPCPIRTHHSFLSFYYLCPEPVWVKRPFYGDGKVAFSTLPLPSRESSSDSARE